MRAALRGLASQGGQSERMKIGTGEGGGGHTERMFYAKTRRHKTNQRSVSVTSWLCCLQNVTSKMESSDPRLVSKRLYCIRIYVCPTVQNSPDPGSFDINVHVMYIGVY